ncbi:MAG: hypothetical protein IT373_32290 [Polyangiaceae bacterium]|nr:hypothetical protein [Polyangiaceae bacterium]
MRRAILVGVFVLGLLSVVTGLGACASGLTDDGAGGSGAATTGSGGTGAAGGSTTSTTTGTTTSTSTTTTTSTTTSTTTGTTTSTSTTTSTTTTTTTGTGGAGGDGGAGQGGSVGCPTTPANVAGCPSCGSFCDTPWNVSWSPVNGATYYVVTYTCLFAHEFQTSSTVVDLCSEVGMCADVFCANGAGAVTVKACNANCCSGTVVAPDTPIACGGGVCC